MLYSNYAYSSALIKKASCIISDNDYNKTMQADKLFKKALLLEYLTIGWNVFEGLSSIVLGMITGSVSLIAYGLESSVEVFASGVTVWSLKGTSRGREKRALKMIGVAYLVVSAYIFIDAGQSLFVSHHATPSFLAAGLVVVLASAMAILGLYKRKVGLQMKNEVVLADAKFTLIDAALSTTVLIGLLFNALFGWWWMDQATALFLSGVAFREGLRELF